MTFMASVTQTAIVIFNAVYSFLKFLGIDILPLTFEKVIEPLTPDERKEASRSNFSVPLKFMLQGFNRNPQSGGFQRYAQLEKAR